MDPVPLAFKIISLSFPSLITKCNISLNLLESSALQMTYTYNFYSGLRIACFIIGLNIDTFCFVNAWNYAGILEALTIVTFKE